MSPAAACLPVGRQMPPPGRTSSGLPDAGKLMPKTLSVINAISVELMIARPSILRLASIAGITSPSERSRPATKVH